MDTFPEDLRVSTMTAISKLSVHINLEKLYENFEINDVTKFIEFRDKIPKGFSKKALRKTRKKEVKKVFFNQATLHIMCDKLVNVKIFNNGTIQMTGLKSIKQGKNVVNMYIEQLKKFNKEIYEGEIVIESFSIVLINSDFDIKYKINRELLHRDLIKSNICSSYEPTIYPGVNMKYYYNTSYNGNGVCQCKNKCNGKGFGNKDGDCKRITIAIFNSGKIIITGGNTLNQLCISYDYINSILKNKKKYMINNDKII